MSVKESLKKLGPVYKAMSLTYYGLQKNLRTARLSFENREKTFSRYYKSNRWKDSQSRSGEGSNLEQTQVIRKILPDVIQRYNVQTLLDVPCGDFFWMTKVDLKNIQYIGGDIVQEMIEKNRESYGTDNIKFEHIDICESPLPQADLILCRDALVHLSFEDIQKALENFKKGGAKYLLTTTFTNREENKDIKTGQWRALNLQKPPFNFPEPIEIYNENYTAQDGRYNDKSIALWEISNL